MRVYPKDRVVMKKYVIGIMNNTWLSHTVHTARGEEEARGKEGKMTNGRKKEEMSVIINFYRHLT